MVSDPAPLAIRASDSERDAALGQLSEACAEGRLSLEEFSNRADLALGAVTRPDLARVLADLPARRPAGSAGAIPWVISIMASTRRSGLWRVGHEVRALAMMGSCEIDLREAVIDSSVVRVQALALMGSVDVIVPEGVEVEFDGAAVVGSRDLRVRTRPALPGSPVVRVTALAFMGSVTVRNRRSIVREAWDRLRS